DPVARRVIERINDSVNGVALKEIGLSNIRNSREAGLCPLRKHHYPPTRLPGTASPSMLSTSGQKLQARPPGTKPGIRASRLYKVAPRTRLRLFCHAQR